MLPQVQHGLRGAKLPLLGLRRDGWGYGCCSVLAGAPVQGGLRRPRDVQRLLHAQGHEPVHALPPRPMQPWVRPVHHPAPHELEPLRAPQRPRVRGAPGLRRERRRPLRVPPRPPGRGFCPPPRAVRVPGGDSGDGPEAHGRRPVDAAADGGPMRRSGGDGDGDARRGDGDGAGGGDAGGGRVRPAAVCLVDRRGRRPGDVQDPGRPRGRDAVHRRRRHRRGGHRPRFDHRDLPSPGVGDGRGGPGAGPGGAGPGGLHAQHRRERDGDAGHRHRRRAGNGAAGGAGVRLPAVHGGG
mmetsp:Transcript_46838/g.101820  ORF Transcript_46838/g.101820 Transcript_46838/m.101820 type:complete len:296 (+) Transcript_46838:1155-2042(+)